MSKDEKKPTNLAEAFAGMTPDQIKNELISQLVKKAKTKKNVLTYSDMADYLDSFDLDKNVVDEIYDWLLYTSCKRILTKVFPSCKRDLVEKRT